MVARHYTLAGADDSVYPPAPTHVQIEPHPSTYGANADEMMHLLKSLYRLWQPRIWSVMLPAPALTANTPQPDPFRFNLEGLWYLSKIMLLPYAGRAVGATFTAITYPSQIEVSVPGFSAMPFYLDSSHNEIHCHVRMFAGAYVQVRNADVTNAGSVYCEWQEVPPEQETT